LLKDEAEAAQWKGSMAQCDSVMTSTEGEATPRREKRGNNVLTRILLNKKIKKIHVVDSADINKQ
jgi:hypothetical protein